jgi:4-hydroxy 2-oxovalerate aldolase
MNISLLDCTLRDGGYYNNWDFSKELIEEYLEAMSSAKITNVELGFRFLKKNIYMGPCAYTTDSFINSLKIPKKIKIGVMINAKDLISNKFSKKEIIKKFFNFKENSISFVRFAAQYNEIDKIIPICDLLKKRGLKVIINLMQISEISFDEIEIITKKISKSKVDVFYFADSLGSLDTEKIINIIKSIKKNWKKDIGFHAHDNMNRALVNGVTAFNNGVKWIDSTVTGMGRGAGNIKTEYALLEFSKKLNNNFDISKLLKLIEEKFYPMQQKYKWGTNPYYFMAGQYKIHPTFIQSMLSDLKLEPFEILSSIANLKKNKTNTFNKNLLEVGEKIYKGKTKGNWNPNTKIKGNNVLILGSGPSSLNYASAIEDFIKKYNPFVIALNAEKSIDEKLINLRVACHALRITSDINLFKKLKQPLALPLKRIPEEQRKNFKKIKIFDYGLEVQSGKFKFGKNSSIAPNPLTIIYALSIANSGKAKQIYLTGLDGYSVDDPRRHEMDDLLKAYLQLRKKAEIISITPTRYKIKTNSVYAL